jgi:hypothetical protein
MERLYRRWDEQRSLFGDLVVIGFLCAQVLDGIFTYLGVTRWGPAIEANPIVNSAVALAGLGLGLSVVKMTAIGFGMLLHLRRVHNLVALLTAVYLFVAIFPWAAIFLTQ